MTRVTFMIGGIIQCVLFFVLPLITYSHSFLFFSESGGYTALQIATGEGFVAVFLLLISPVIILIAALVNASSGTLRNISIVGLIAQIIFIIVASSMDQKISGNNFIII